MGAGTKVPPRVGLPRQVRGERRGVASGHPSGPCPSTNPEGRPVINAFATRPATPAARLRRRLAVVATATLAVVTLASVVPVPANATIAGDMALQIVRSMNADRVARGLVPYRTWGALGSLARDRAARMASRNTLSHAAAGGNVGTAMTSRGIQWYTYGEALGTTGYPYGSKAAAHLYAMWKGSPAHRALLYSATFNYVGVGIVYNSSTRTTWASILFSESRDRTGAVARNGTPGVKGRTITFSWSGYDPRLQTHTAGLRSFDVQYRVNGGSWRLLRNDTTGTALTLADRPRGAYGFRVQAADRRGTLGAWTSETKVWVP